MRPMDGEMNEPLVNASTEEGAVFSTTLVDSSTHDLNDDRIRKL